MKYWRELLTKMAFADSRPRQSQPTLIDGIMKHLQFIKDLKVIDTEIATDAKDPKYVAVQKQSVQEQYANSGGK